MMNDNMPVDIEAVRATLAQRFPGAFLGKSAWKKPLAIGIHHELFKRCPDLSKRSIRMAIRDYVYGPKYQRNLKLNAVRFDLDGKAAGAVTGEQAKAAQRLCMRMKRQRKAERAQKSA